MFGAIFAGLIPRNKDKINYNQTLTKCKILFVSDIRKVSCGSIIVDEPFTLNMIMNILYESGLNKRQCERIRYGIMTDPDIRKEEILKRVNKILIRKNLSDFLLIENQMVEEGGKILIVIN